YNRYVIGRISIDNLYIAQNEKDQALNQFVQALRGYWQAHYRLRRATLYDFETGQPIPSPGRYLTLKSLSAAEAALSRISTRYLPRGQPVGLVMWNSVTAGPVGAIVTAVESTT